MSIEQRVEQMYRALGEMKIIDQPTVLPIKSQVTGPVTTVSVDLDRVADEITAANRASQLLNNIACLKDYLKVWCEKNGQTFGGDALIDSNKDVAIIHDLWNRDKHGALKRSRSGLFPDWKERPTSVIKMTSGPGTTKVGFTVNMSSGAVQRTGNMSVSILAVVADKDGNILGPLEGICEKAVDAWQAEFKKVGLNI